MDLLNNGLDGVRFLEEKVSKPFYMNFDEDGHGPESWPTKFNIDNWGIFVAIKDEIYVGGMTLAYQTPNVNMLEGKNDISVLWDIRVLPEYRGLGLEVCYLSRLLIGQKNEVVKG